MLLILCPYIHQFKNEPRGRSDNESVHLCFFCYIYGFIAGSQLLALDQGRAMDCDSWLGEVDDTVPVAWLCDCACL